MLNMTQFTAAVIFTGREPRQTSYLVAGAVLTAQGHGMCEARDVRPGGLVVLLLSCGGARLGESESCCSLPRCRVTRHCSAQGQTALLSAPPDLHNRVHSAHPIRFPRRNCSNKNFHEFPTFLSMFDCLSKTVDPVC